MHHQKSVLGSQRLPGSTTVAAAHRPRWHYCANARARSRALTPPPAATQQDAVAASSAPSPSDKQPPAVYLQDGLTASFLDWARGAGIAFDRLRPAQFGGLRGLAAAAPIRADDVILSVPRAAALTLPPRQRCPCPEFVTPEFWDAAPWFVRLGVRLLAERRKGAASPLAQYLQQLPKDVDAPVGWDQGRLKQLQYPYIIAKATEQQREWGAFHERLSASGMAAGVAAPSRAEFFWALSCVRSRTFSGPYVASTLQDRLRLAGLVGFLAVGNVLLQGPDAIENSVGAAVAVFVFNILYEVILSQKLKQYAMCPVIDLANHSSKETVGYFWWEGWWEG
jgi:hypothetical protein